MRQKYIILDIDGVMTNFHDQIGSYLNHSPKDYGISKSNLERLFQLCRNTRAKVVISSNWRKFDDDGYWVFNSNRYYNTIPSLKKSLGKYYSGMLPPTRHTTKAKVLISWIEDNNIHDFDFVIFDDDVREEFGSTHTYSINQHFILTNPEFGLTDDNVEQAKEILEK